MKSLTWGQVNAWRMAQQGLSDRLQAGQLVEAVRRTMGIHAQLMSAAELAIAAQAERLGKFLNSPVLLEFSQD